MLTQCLEMPFIHASERNEKLRPPFFVRELCRLSLQVIVGGTRYNFFVRFWVTDLNLAHREITFNAETFISTSFQLLS